jgi:hypothetical protein
MFPSLLFTIKDKLINIWLIARNDVFALFHRLGKSTSRWSEESSFLWFPGHVWTSDRVNNLTKSCFRFCYRVSSGIGSLQTSQSYVPINSIGVAEFRQNKLRHHSLCTKIPHQRFTVVDQNLFTILQIRSGIEEVNSFWIVCSTKLPELVTETAFSKDSKKVIERIETHPKEKHQTLTVSRGQCQSHGVIWGDEKEERMLFYGNIVEVH